MFRRQHASAGWQGGLVVAPRVLIMLALLLPGLIAQAAEQQSASGNPGAATHAPPRKSRFPVGGMPDGARAWYAQNYGVDDLSAQLTDSGALVRFSYRVVDAAKAQPLQDRAAAPNMLDQASHAVLSIPVMDKVGPLRQSMPAKNGMSYWMAFSNKSSPVKTGHRVSVVIGSVRIDGLIVQ
jgi:hypothetical protein